METKKFVREERVVKKRELMVRRAAVVVDVSTRLALPCLVVAHYLLCLSR